MPGCHSVEAQLAYLTKGCVDVVRPAELRAKLERSVTVGRPLVVKVGFDPTAPDLHLGHTVLIRKMKHFQDLGHTVVYVVGAFTALIGDPTGRSKTRPPLTIEEIGRNAETYQAQIFKILDQEKTVTRFNSDWLEPLGSFGWIGLAAKYNVAQMLERRDFRKRYDTGQPIAIHEFLYPLAQAYDSVHLKADVELGGTDQLFNLNVGRDIMPAFGLEPQVVMTTPLLEGLDGVEKMSKSAGNYVGITEPAAEMFGKLMSISDELMWRYYTLLTDVAPADLERLREGVAAGVLHPKQVKVDLASAIVGDFHGPVEAARAAEEFERRFAKKELDVSALEVVRVAPGADGSARLASVMVEAGLASSAAEAQRKIQQGGVRIDRQRVGDVRARCDASRPSFVLEVGRRAVRVEIVDG
jgi:tyrosyl-tRNA synthetase